MFLLLFFFLLPSWTSERARFAAISRGVRAGERTQAELDEAKRKFNEAMQPRRVAELEEHVERVVSAWPPLTDEQVNRIAARLRAGGGSA